MDPNHKTTLWKIVQSWWILLTLVMFLHWSAFFYIAMRVKSKPFAIWGVVYTLTCFGGIITGTSTEQTSWQSNVGFAVFLISWVICIIHALMVRKEFLLRLEARQLSSIREENNLKRKIESEYGVDFDLPESEHPKRPLPPTVPTKGRVIRQSSHNE
ncbi:hypothetical protein ACP8HI_01325 [Paenibacillus sp. FA6]|uniref:hypothetical protein n=1 Tax=Paenibacillus sp. FA6 TaxID=3413029 RepID=UPI003F65DD79